MTALTKQQAREALWRRGNLRWLLREYQKPIYDSIRSSEGIQFMLNCSRRLGKTTILVIIALEEALKTKDGRFQFTTSTGKAMRGIIKPIIKMMTLTCPEDIRPVWKGVDDCYYFPSTGAELFLAGSNNGHEDDSRGMGRNICFIDEAQAIDNLEYLITSVLMPQTIDQTGGRIIISGTPPESPAHYYKQLYYNLKTKNCTQHYDIYSNTAISKKQVDLFAEESGGYDSTAWKREYLAMFVTESSRAVVPEWNDDTMIIKDWEPPFNYTYFQRYVSMDIGGVDNTAILYGYYDFPRACLVIQKEWVRTGPEVTSGLIAEEVKGTEKTMWNGIEPFRRIADNNNKILLHDLANVHECYFQSTSKDSLHAMVNKVREWCKNGRIEIDEKCEQLIGCLGSGIWDKPRKQFDKSSLFGHFDALAALVYMVRSIDEHSNTVPELQGKSPADHFIPADLVNKSTNHTRNTLKGLIKHK